MGALFRLLAWPFFIVMNIAICLLLLITSVLGTDYGTKQAVAAAERWLPLTVESVEGNLLNELNISGLSYEDSSVSADIAQLAWRFNLSALWEQDRLAHIRELSIQNATITLASTADAPAEPEPTTTPFSPEDINLSFGVKIDAITLEDIRLNQGDQSYSIEALNLQAEADQQGNSNAQLALTNGPFTSNANITLAANMTQQAVNAEVKINTLNANINQQNVAAQGAIQLSFSPENQNQSFSVSAQQLTANYGSASLTANGTVAQGQTLKLAMNTDDLGLATPELGGSLQLTGEIQDASRLALTADLRNITWLNEPQLSQGTVNWQGSLAEQQLDATLATPLLNNQTLALNSQLGWRDSFASLLDALQLPPSSLLKQPALHFKAEALLPSAQIATTGVELRNNSVAIALVEDGDITLSGHSESGKGHLDLNGLLQLLEGAEPPIAAETALTGSEYQLANTPELKLSVSPELNAKLSDNLLTVRGQLTVNNGHIEIIVPEEGALTPSGDVVILKDGEAATDAAAELGRDIAIKLIVAEPITLEGQGFKGDARGQLTVTEQNGKPPRARGELILAGQFEAYGQDLTIRRGKLIYVDSPIDNPGVDLEAIRTVDEQIAGVRVSGLASNPKIEIFAEPALPETEALAYLVLGRGLDSNSEQDQMQMRNLALSLGLARGGKFLEKSKDKLGVDELTIQTGNSNNEASLLVGRQLSEKLYLSTQIGLFEPVAKLLLRYKLSRKCEVIAETGTQQGADIACSITTD